MTSRKVRLIRGIKPLLEGPILATRSDMARRSRLHTWAQRECERGRHVRSRLEASLEAGAVAIVLNTAALKLAAHGGLRRLISPWLAAASKGVGLAVLWQGAGAMSATSPIVQTGFHLATGIAMAVV